MCSLGLNLGYSVRIFLMLANDSVHQSSMSRGMHIICPCWIREDVMAKAFPNERNSQGNKRVKAQDVIICVVLCQIVGHYVIVLKDILGNVGFFLLWGLEFQVQKLYIYMLFIYFSWWGVCGNRHAMVLLWKSEDNMKKLRVSSSRSWAPGSELRPLGSKTRTFTH